MNYGVPQGSILGPLLFLIYIYDMKYILSKCIVYADDTTIIVRGKTLSEAIQNTNIILKQYYDYFALNKLTLNESKTKYRVSKKKGLFLFSLKSDFLLTLAVVLGICCIKPLQRFIQEVG